MSPRVDSERILYARRVLSSVQNIRSDCKSYYQRLNMCLKLQDLTRLLNAGDRSYPVATKMSNMGRLLLVALALMQW